MKGEAAVPLTLILVLLAASFLITDRPVSGAEAITENSWATKAPMRQARAGLGVATVSGKIYAIGGSTLQGSWPYSGGIVATNEEYNPATNTWVFKTPMPTPRMDFGIAIYNNKIYCIGGEEIFKDDSRAPLTNVNEVYDPATDTWETKTPMPTPRSGVRAAVVNGKIYLIGGNDPNVHFEPGASTHNEVYDPATDSWSTKSPLPTASYNYASAAFGDKIYIIGGLIGGPSEGLRFDLNQVYNAENDSWSFGAPLSQSYGEATSVVTVGFMAPQRIYVFGAMRNGFGMESYYSAQVYNPESDSWMDGANIPTDRGGFGVAILDDMAYVIGGETASGIPFSSEAPTLTKYATSERYVPFGYGTVQPIVTVVSPQSRNYSAPVSLNFTVNRSVDWLGYSLDGQENVTVSGNVTLAGLPSALHNVTVYAKDAFENEAASKTITFNVTVPEPSPTVPVVAASAVSIAAVTAVGLILFARRRRRREAQQT